MTSSTLTTCASTPSTLPEGTKAGISESPLPAGSAPRISFSFTLRKVDATGGLGLEISHSAWGPQVLRVEGVKPGTPMDAWNRQCIGTGKTVEPGDLIMSVNGASDREGMMA